ncbi:carbon-nitrogen hydrolase [Morchella snyderi]|nr:carbon-nitrogen hydrolase [Morchella snyderi]
MTAKKFKCAVIQLHPKPMQMEGNFQRARTFIQQAAIEGAELAVLPEYCLTSWVPSEPRFADAADDRTYLTKFCELAKECNINIVPGTFVEKHVSPDEEDGKEMLYNVAYFISNTGEVLGSYTKKNLWHAERGHLEAAGHNPHSVIDTPLGKVGLLICWDLAFPEAFRALVTQGANIIIIPTFWTLKDLNEAALSWNPNSEAIFLQSVVVSRAYENIAAIIFSNAGGREGSGFAGLSQITMPLMGPIAKAEGTHEQMVIGEIDLQILEDAEDSYKIRADIAQPDYHYAVTSKI